MCEIPGASEISREEELREFCQEHYIVILEEDAMVRQGQINEACRQMCTMEMSGDGSGEEKLKEQLEQQEQQDQQEQQEQQEQEDQEEQQLEQRQDGATNEDVEETENGRGEAEE